MMNKNEKELFKSLCSYKSESFNESLLDAATPAVLGHLFLTACRQSLTVRWKSTDC